MISTSYVITLLFVAFINYPTPCESLKCYECSGNKSCGQGQIDHIVDCAGKCMSYLNEDNSGTLVRRCCLNDCETENGHKAYFCSKDKCNGVHSDRKLLAFKNTMSKKRIHLRAVSEGDENGSSLSCYDCSSYNPNCGISMATLVQGCETCVVYHNTYDASIVVRKCCTSGCGSPGTIGEFDGRKAYFCSSNQCNGIGAEKVLAEEAEIQSTTTISATLSSTQTTVSTTIQSSFSCYECLGLNEQQCTTTTLNCPMCMVYRNDNDPAKFDRRCCWWGCGTSNQITDYAGRPTYFCNADKCNGPGSEAIFDYANNTNSTTITRPSTITTTARTTTNVVTTEPSSSKCYDCSGSDCGREGSSMSNCPKCIVYRNPTDQTQIERRCCWWNCGPSHSLSSYNGLETYFCAGDKCNGYGAESALSPPVTTTPIRTTTTTATTAITTTTAAATTEPSSSKCYDCAGSDCGREGSSMSNCPKCMVYRNPTDQTKIERRCCWWNCGPSHSLSSYNGLETYFCAGDKCNGYGAEFALSPPVTTIKTTSITATAVTTTPIRTTGMTTTTTATTAVTTTTAATTEPSSSKCYDCSGSDCGREGSSTSNCPKCIVYRNPTDQTKIERRCCWWNCGPSHSLGSYNGLETYFCAGDKCNGYGAESALSPPVTTTTVTMMTTSIAMNSDSTTTTTSSSAASCVLNCKNGGTPETEDGCFCYCLDKTNGRECENVNCAEPDVDPETCSLENQQLCEESETFAFECLHLCGKC